jgi:hypothetical protein
LFPSLLADWQEIAVTVDRDASILAAVRVTNGQHLAEMMNAFFEYAGEDEKEINGNPAEYQTPETYKGYRFFSATMPISEYQVALGRMELDNGDETPTIIEERKDLKRMQWLDGKSLQYCLAISDEVVALTVGLSPVDATQRLKEAIDRNEEAQAQEQGFPETVLVFATPTEGQWRTLDVLYSEDHWWEDDDSPFSPPDLPRGQIRVRSTLTDTSRTDQVRINRELVDGYMMSRSAERKRQTGQFSEELSVSPSLENGSRERGESQ